MKLVYKCDFCSETRVDARDMQMHEKTCYFNPANKRCGSCAHSELQDGYGNTLCMNDEVTQEHWIDIEEEKGPCEFHKAK